MFSNSCPEYRAVYKKMCKNMVQPDRSKMTIYTAHAGLLRLQTHTRNINTYCFSTARMVNVNAPQYYVYTYFACLVLISMLFFFFFAPKEGK